MGGDIDTIDNKWPETVYGSTANDPVTKPSHNHELALGPIAFPHHRQRSEETRKQIENLTKAALKPRDIQAVLLQYNPDLLITRTDILNTRGQLRRALLGDLTSTQALLLALDQC